VTMRCLPLLWCLGAAFEGVPVVDLGRDAERASADVVAALKRTGFFYAENHGIPQFLIDAQFAEAERLFALPPEAKRALEFDVHLDIGYLGAGGQALDTEEGRDTKEGFLLSNNGVFDPAHNVSLEDPLAGATLRWPPLEGYELILRRYTAACYALNHRLNYLLFRGLGLNDTERLAIARQPFAVTKQLRYAPGAAGDLGAGAHTDWGAFTVLATDDAPGLQVQSAAGEWLPVPPREGCLIVNAGDQLRVWTTGALRSGNHRVVVDPGARRPRLSTAFFAYFDLHSVLTPLPQFLGDGPPLRPPERTMDYFHFKLRESVENAAKRGEVDASAAKRGAEL